MGVANDSTTLVFHLANPALYAHWQALTLSETPLSFLHPSDQCRKHMLPQSAGSQFGATTTKGTA